MAGDILRTSGEDNSVTLAKFRTALAAVSVVAFDRKDQYHAAPARMTSPRAPARANFANFSQTPIGILLDLNSGSLMKAVRLEPTSLMVAGGLSQESDSYLEVSQLNIQLIPNRSVTIPQ